MDPLEGEWQNISNIGYLSYTCGYCGEKTGVKVGYSENHGNGAIYICGGCNRPTFIDEDGSQTPAPIFGNPVLHLPPDLHDLYNQARRCTQVEAFTATTLICRKILMHVAVECGAQPGQTFAQYVQYLIDHNFITQNMRAWVDAIRARGNEANHQIITSQKNDAEDLLSFTEMLLKVVYEYPTRGRPIPATAQATTP